MAASITHLVVGEHVFRQVTHLNPTVSVYGSFLAGCVLVDVHVFHDINRRQTHFAGRFEEGRDSYSKSCSSFLSGLEVFLRRPWIELERAEQAFVMGYLCHLAVDECWKDFGFRLLQKLGIPTWMDLPVPFDVLLTAFDFLSQKLLIDPATVFVALQNATIPDVFKHIPHEILHHQRNLIHGYVMSSGTPAAYVKMLEDAGESNDRIQEARQQHDIYWDDSIRIVNSMGGVVPFIQTAAARAIDVIPESWIHSIDSNDTNPAKPFK